jgi:hypothetical protein
VLKTQADDSEKRRKRAKENKEPRLTKANQARISQMGGVKTYNGSDKLLPIDIVSSYLTFVNGFSFGVKALLRCPLASLF